MARLVLDAVSKHFGVFSAVRDLDLEIEDGEFTVLVGPSGCGKSTALRIIAGLEDPSTGRVLIGGKDVTAVSPKDRDIAMVFQDYALYPHMTVFENMAFGLVMRRMPRAETERRVRDAAAMLGLNALLARRPRELSGGQRQRVALGRAIVRQPAVFLFDEPLSNLDAALRIEMRAELSRLHDRLQTTSVFVTHDQVEAMTMGSKIVVMRDGRIQQVGPPLGVYHAPANRFVAGFIGSPRMNFLDGAVIEDAKGVGVLCGGLRIPLPGGDDAAWRSQIGRAVTLGLRPGDIHEPRSGEGPDAWRVEAEAVVVEPLGPETHVHARIDRHELVAVLGPTVYVRPHDRIPLVLELGRMHVFAVDGEQERILPTGRRDSRAA